jgi:hypothetical protein
MMRTHVLPALGDVRLSRLRQRHLRDLATDLFAKDLSRNTVRLAVAPLRATISTSPASRLGDAMTDAMSPLVPVLAAQTGRADDTVIAELG